MSSQLSLSRFSGPHTPQKIGALAARPFVTSRMTVPRMKSVYRPPEFSKLNLRLEYWASTKNESVRTPL